MKNKEKLLEITNRLKKEYAELKTALIFKTPFELLVSTILSAQTTDVHVNKVTENLFKKYKNVKDYAGVSRNEFLNYFQDVEKGAAIFIKDVWLLPKPIHLAELRKEVKGFHPPQNFRYTSVRQVESFQ